MALASQEMTKRKAQHGRHSAKHHDPYQIALGITVCVRTGAEEIKERPAKRKSKEGKYKRCHCTAPHAESGYVLDIFMVLLSKHSRDETAASQSKQISQRRQKIEPRGNQ